MKRVRIRRIVDRRPIAGAAIFLWVALSPWIWGFADSHAAVANHVALVFGFAPLALIMVNLRPAAVVTLPAGIWLAASPWALGYATDHTAWLNELSSGLALIVLCASAAGASFLSRARTRRAMERGESPPVVANTAAPPPDLRDGWDPDTADPSRRPSGAHPRAKQRHCRLREEADGDLRAAVHGDGHVQNGHGESAADGAYFR